MILGVFLKFANSFHPWLCLKPFRTIFVTLVTGLAQKWHICNTGWRLYMPRCENHRLQKWWRWFKQVPWIPFTKTFFWVIWWSPKSNFRICKETRSNVITINYWTFYNFKITVKKVNSQSDSGLRSNIYSYMIYHATFSEKNTLWVRSTYFMI